jgi:secreted trypsin-like serine protease
MRISFAAFVLLSAVAFHDLLRGVHANTETRAGANPVKQQASTASRIVNGQVAQEGRYPFAVSLVTSGGSHFCGGKLLKVTGGVQPADRFCGYHCLSQPHLIYFNNVSFSILALSDVFVSHVFAYFLFSF